MIIQKDRNFITVKAYAENKGMRIDISNGVQVSLATNKPYSNQETGAHLERIMRLYNQRNGNPSWTYVLPNRGKVITEMSEAEALVGVYYGLISISPATAVLGASILQLFYSHKYAVRLYDVESTTRYVKDYRLDHNKVVKYLIERGLTSLNHESVREYQAYKNGVDLSELNEKQKRFITSVLNNGLKDKKKIDYLIRKVRAEHIDYMLTPREIEKYFELADLLEISFNQKNFLNAFANMKYQEEIRKDELLTLGMKKNQDTRLKLDTENYYAVLPTTPKELAEMGATMHNCIGGYADMVANGTSKIIFVYSRETNKPVLNIEVRLFSENKYHIAQFLGPQNDWSAKDRHPEYYKALSDLITTINNG